MTLVVLHRQRTVAEGMKQIFSRDGGPYLENFDAIGALRKRFVNKLEGAGVVAKYDEWQRFSNYSAFIISPATNKLLRFGR